MTEAKSNTLDVPGATLTYDIRRNDTSTKPPLFLLGSPMAASGFSALAGYFPERTVVTYDPRGAERSAKTDGSNISTPEQHAEDIHAVIEAIGGGPVDMFASSGGAVNALALVARHPGDVRILVAHEPPSATVLSDRENALAAIRSIHETYLQRGFGAGMAKFIATTSFQGPFPDGFADLPAPDPQVFGFPAQDDGKRDDPLLQQNTISCTSFEPDFQALLSAPTRIVIAAGEESSGQMASRAAHAIADQLATDVAVFPSGHGGFVEGWGKPEPFAAKLHEVIATAA